MLFPGLPFWEESWVSSQTLGKNITSTAPGAEKDRKAKALNETNSKSTLPAPNSIEFGVGKVDFRTESDQKHQIKNRRAFPLVLRVKSRTMRSASSQQKIDERFPPSEGLKWAHSDRQATRKRQKKIHERFPFF